MSHIDRQAHSSPTTRQGAQQAVNRNGLGNIDVRHHDNAGQMGVARNFARVSNNGTHGPQTHPDVTHSMRQQTGLNSNTEGNSSAANLVSHDDPKKANYVSQMFNNSQLSGQIKQDILEIIKMYTICSRQYQLSQAQQADFFVHLFFGSARRYFLTNTSPNMPLHIMVDVMTKEYVSDARQLQVKTTLEMLRLRSFMQDEDISDESSGLLKLVKHINELPPQCPPNFRSDAHKISYLRRAVAEYQDWSRIPIANITS